jgi:hypothetical protein
MLLHIPSGNYVSKVTIDIEKKMSWNTFARGPELITVWGFDVPADAKPIKFDSKTKAKTWLRQKAPGKRGTLFTIIEIRE